MPIPFSGDLTFSCIASTIVKKYERAVKEQAEISDYFEALTDACSPELIALWTREIGHAEAARQQNVKSMDYMNARVDKG